MKFVNFLAIDLHTKSGDFKLSGVQRGGDGSFYFPYASTDYICKVSGGVNNSVPVKYSRHVTGKKCRITVGPENNRLAEFAGEDKPKIGNIKLAEGATYVSLSDVNNNIEVVLDKSDGRPKYDNRLVINAKSYKNITLNFYIAKKDSFRQLPDKRWKEIHHYTINGFYIIVAVEDSWQADQDAS